MSDFSLVIDIVVGLVLGIVFGAITAFGAFFTFGMLTVVYKECDFEGTRLIRLLKFALFVVVGILLFGMGGVFGPFLLGVIALHGIGSDPSSPPILDAVFYSGYFGTLVAYAICGIRSNSTDQGRMPKKVRNS